MVDDVLTADDVRARAQVAEAKHRLFFGPPLWKQQSTCGCAKTCSCDTFCQQEALDRQREQQDKLMPVVADRKPNKQLNPLPQCIPHPTIGEIINEVSREFCLEKMDLISHRRMPRLSVPRQIVMYLSRTMTPHSFPLIGSKIGDRDHSTIIHGCKLIAAMIRTDSTIADVVERIRGNLEQCISRRLCGGGNMKIHELKSWPDFFGPIFDGRKRFDVRLNDRRYVVGDGVHLREYDDRAGAYTGREWKGVISYVLAGSGPGAIPPLQGIRSEYVVLSLSPSNAVA
jgi:hypothetical protein